MSLLDEILRHPARGCLLDREGIMRLLPHRPPFLMLDRVTAIEPSLVVAEKEVAASESCFEGHFPGNPVFPGALQIEAMAQAMALAMLFADESFLGGRPVFMGIEKCRFRLPVVPDCLLTVRAELKRLRGSVGVCETEILLGGELASNAVLHAMMKP